jgi:chromosome segregation protein
LFLKTLTIKGFKSFADPVVLDMEPGVTVVVGPNGSGKSNVVDAIAWVLGAQAPSAVRSQKMDDVIFAGTAKRQQLGRAEVSLTIDNSDGVLPIEFNEVTVTRTLFRSGDSEYAINRSPCRLLDIQELLSDSGVGRQQHVIVSQGQIDAVLNARPEERRLIIEEAAGVLKYRRRKERSERRLASTEANLTRLQDLLREVRRQLRPLERQAEAARRHGALIGELTALRVFVAGRELASLKAKLASGAQQRAQLGADEAALRQRLAELDAQVMQTESELTAMGEDDLGDVLGRYEALRERARGLVAVLAERRRGLERDHGAAADRGVIANLEAEAARLVSELEAVEHEAAQLAPLGEQLEEAEAELAGLRSSFEERWAEGVPVPSGEAAEVRGELAALRAATENGTREQERVAGRVAGLEEKLAALAVEIERLRDELAAAERAELPLVEALDAAEAEQGERAAASEAAEERRRRAVAERQVAEARVEALALALDQARSRAGTERLAGVDGVLGTLLDLVAVDPGWEGAFDGAAGEALARGGGAAGGVAQRRGAAAAGAEARRRPAARR